MSNRSNRYPLVAAAVAAALSGVAHAAPPTLAQAEAPNFSLVVAGSSAAESAFGVSLGADLCGGTANVLTMKAEQPGGATTPPAGNFESFSCVVTSGAAGLSTTLANGSNVFTFYYRAEGGSVVGALPLASTLKTTSNSSGGQGLQKINRLNLSDTSCTASGTSGTCVVNGASSTVGTDDGWTGAVVEDYVQLGVTDVEPTQFGNGSTPSADYPSAYSTNAFGSASAAQLSGLTATPVFQQVFGLFVNTSGLGTSTVNLSRESAANILLGNYFEWSSVPDAISGAAVGTGAITVVNREAGSGTRTGTNLYFFGYGCGASLNNIAEDQPQDYYATADALTSANGLEGAIAYASIDNFGTKYPNLVLATINGIAPGNKAAAAGEYDWWYEATLIKNNNSTVTGSSGANPYASAIISAVTTELQNYKTAPSQDDINAIPKVTTENAVSSEPPLISYVATGGTQTVYLNPYTRAGNSCNAPTEDNE